MLICPSPPAAAASFAYANGCAKSKQKFAKNTVSCFLHECIHKRAPQTKLGFVQLI